MKNSFRKLDICTRGLLAVCFLWLAASAHAATLTVDTLADDATKTACTAALDDCSLRGALAAAADGDTIDFSVTGTILLTNGHVLVDKSVTISGPAANVLAVNGNANGRVFVIGSGKTVTISGLTITNGFGQENSITVLGGGIYNDHAVLTLEHCSISGNSGFSGAGIYNDGRLGDDGLFAGSATLTIRNSTISGNTNIGITNSGYATTTVENSTISGNSSATSGGAIFNSANLGVSTEGGTAIVTIRNTTLSGNSSPSAGDLRNSGHEEGTAIISIGSTIIKAGSSASIVNVNDGTITSNGFNLSSDAAGGDGTTGPGGFLNATGDKRNTDPMLGPLQYNGGPTRTHALVHGSPAVNAGTNPLSLLNDQRGTGFDRVVGTAADIGAFEIQPACAGIAFSQSAGSPVPASTPVSIAVGDFNLDGKPDLTIAQRFNNNVMIRLGNGSGGFGTAGFVGTGGQPFSVAVGDFNLDSKPDLAVANSSSDNVTIQLGNGSGGFTQPAGSPVGAGSVPVSVAVGDFNLDGKPDLAVANASSDNVTILLGDGSGGFTQPAGSPVGAGDGPQSVAVVDFNLDGKPDLAVANGNSDNVTILVGNGSGGFTQPVGSPVGAGSFPRSVAVGDFNLDGKPDLAVTNFGSDNVTILLGNGSGGFTQPAGSPVGTGNIPFSVAVGDFNLDGKPDLTVANFSSDNVTILLGNGSGGFTQPAGSPVGAGDGPVSVAVGDFNLDGKPDLAAANTASNNVSVLLNTCLQNSAPVAVDDNRSTNEDTPLSGSSVLGNDSDGDNDPLVAVLVTGPSNAQSFALNPDGTFNYTPNPNFFGSDSFTYKANDGALDSNVATVTITVHSVNDLPTVEVVQGGSCASNGKAGTMNLVVSDVESGAGSLSLGRSSSNTTVVPLANIAFGGSGANRTVSITAVQQNSTQSSVVTITVGDGDGGTSQVTIRVIVGSNNNVTINGTGGADMIIAGNGNDTVNAGAGNDLVCGGTGNDTVNGGAGDDTIDGGNGNDILRGDAGNDTLRGGEGNDRLEGGNDNDALTGGLGGDRFLGGAGTDTATDFNAGQGDTTDGTIP